MADVLVQASGISKGYIAPSSGVINALQSVDCQIHDGDRIAVVGPSGSGKSTLFHILGGLIEPTSGNITWPALGAREKLQPQKIQFVFQSPSLFPALTVSHNVALPLVLAGDSSNVGPRVADMLERFGLSELLGKLPEELSGGQAQRIAMARALIISPKLILADEPTGQLDSATTAAFLETVFDIVAETGAALIIATHDQSVARRMDGRWVIEHGRLYTQRREPEVAS